MKYRSIPVPYSVTSVVPERRSLELVGQEGGRGSLSSGLVLSLLGGACGPAWPAICLLSLVSDDLAQASTRCTQQAIWQKEGQTCCVVKSFLSSFPWRHKNNKNSTKTCHVSCVPGMIRVPVPAGLYYCCTAYTSAWVCVGVYGCVSSVCP